MFSRKFHGYRLDGSYDADLTSVCPPGGGHAGGFKSASSARRWVRRHLNRTKRG